MSSGVVSKRGEKDEEEWKNERDDIDLLRYLLWEKIVKYLQLFVFPSSGVPVMCSSCGLRIE